MAHRRWTVLQNNSLSFLIYTNSNPGNLCGNRYPSENDGGRNIKLGWVEFTDRGSLSKDSVFCGATQFQRAVSV